MKDPSALSPPGGHAGRSGGPAASAGPAAASARSLAGRAGRTAVVADSHIGGPGGPAGPLVEQLLGLAEEGCERLVLLGDLFQAWVGDRRYETPDIAAVASALESLGRAGLPIHYVEGNRDFFLGDGPYRHLFKSVGTELAFTSGDVRYLAVHGDGLDERDRLYRFWRAVSKSALSRFLARRVPGPLARRLVHSTEERLSRTNLEHKRVIPTGSLARWGEERLREGHDVVLLGHFHEAHRLEVPGGEVRLLPAWYDSREIVWV